MERPRFFSEPEPTKSMKSKRRARLISKMRDVITSPEESYGEGLLLTTGDLVIIYGVNPKIIRKWGNEGKLVSVRTPGNQRRFPATPIWAQLQTVELNSKGDYTLTTGDVVERLKISARTVRLWEKKGRLTAIRTLGGNRRFSESEVANLL